MAAGSITSSESFAARIQRSEQWRTVLMALVLTVSLISMIIRRWLGGVVMTVDALFYPSVGVILVGIAFQGWMLLEFRRSERAHRVMQGWRWVLGGAVDLAVPLSCLFLLQLHSPRGAYAALSAPVLLLMPIVSVLSILRLRPWFSLLTGVIAGAGHALLVLRAISVEAIDRTHWPLLFTYAVLMVLTGVAAAAVCKQARRYLRETVDEVTAAERTRQALEGVKHDLAVAREIQMGLLPTLVPNLAGFEIAAMNRPADETGGDYYDWQPLLDGRVAVAIADVTGHGIGPALMMAVCRAYSRAASPAAPTPEAILQRINDLIVNDIRGGRFITMAIAILSADGGVRLASAGHGPTLLLRASDQSVQVFGGDGLPLGITGDELYDTAHDFYMQTGDCLVLLTDGFVEWSRGSDSQLFGTQRLTEVIRERQHASASEILAAIDRAVQEFSQGTRQADDTTAVVIKRV